MPHAAGAKDSPRSAASISVLLDLARRRLNLNQKRVLISLTEHQGRTFSSAAQALAHELGLDPSTARRALRLFRDCGLIESGNGEPLAFTQTGILLLERVRRDG